ncbi:MAG: diguanylate cyclase [Armatimonadetes bacterium]|nr:diguanylate cyclase [Armatimonadota bacterium]
MLPSQEPDEWLTIEQAARKLGLSKETLRRWIKAGKLPLHRLGPRRVRVRASEVYALVGLSATSRSQPGAFVQVAEECEHQPHGVVLPFAASEAIARQLMDAVTWDQLFEAVVRGLHATFRSCVCGLVCVAREHEGWVVGVPRTWVGSDRDKSRFLTLPYIQGVVTGIHNQAGQLAPRLPELSWQNLSVVLVDVQISAELRGHMPTRVLMSPIYSPHVQGLLFIADPAREAPLSAENMDHLLNFWTTALCSGAARVLRIIECERIAYHDELTGLYNRRALQKFLEDHLALLKRYGRPVTLLFVDVANFKQVNDRFGHLAGDDVLRSIAEELRGSVREADIVTRYGGDEFVIICPETTAQQAEKLAARLVQRLASLQLPSGEPVRVNIGIAQANAAAVPTPRELVEAADRSLYEAKRRGVHIFSPEQSSAGQDAT